MDDGVHGLLSNERDVDELADQILEIMHWGKKPENRKRIVDEYNKSKHGQQLIEIYRRAQQL